VTIHLRPDQETKIQEAIRAGLIQSAEDIIDAGLEHLCEHPCAPPGAMQGTLVEFFRRSPLFGLDLDLERDKDTGRDVEL
jgi:hypothetical protein